MIDTTSHIFLLLSGQIYYKLRQMMKPTSKGLIYFLLTDRCHVWAFGAKQ